MLIKIVADRANGEKGNSMDERAKQGKDKAFAFWNRSTSLFSTFLLFFLKCSCAVPAFSVLVESYYNDFCNGVRC